MMIVFATALSLLVMAGQDASASASTIEQEAEAIGRVVITSVACQEEGRLFTDAASIKALGDRFEHRAASAGVSADAFQVAAKRGVEAEMAFVGAKTSREEVEAYLDERCPALLRDYPETFRPREDQ